jgi:pimeloyl-ACP methyl ester carboxylesterase
MRRATHRLPGLVLTEHVFELPHDHATPDGPTIEVFAREVSRPGAPEGQPFLVFLQGGPGFCAPRPTERRGWIGRALEDYRLLLVDQRGTGRSTAVDGPRLAAVGDAAAQASYLRHFRSDSVVRDCEAIRHQLGVGPWSVLGQSYGGFCVLRYLSAAPEGLSEAFITGGIPPLRAEARDIYRRTYELCKLKNRLYYERYPEDVQRIRDIADHLSSRAVHLPGGDPFSVRRLQTLGLQLGFSDGFEVVHYLVEDAFTRGPSGLELSHGFMRGVQNAQSWDTNPIFSVLHEACYTQGTASGWAAESLRAEHPEFGLDQDGPLYLTGEMIYPWLFEEVGELRPLHDVAHLLAETEEWPVLYDPAALRQNEVPAAAAVYANDMYVEREYSMETAAAVPGLQTWLTDEYEHNGLRADGARVLGRLIDMGRGEA